MQLSTKRKLSKNEAFRFRITIKIAFILVRIIDAKVAKIKANFLTFEIINI